MTRLLFLLVLGSFSSISLAEEPKSPNPVADARTEYAAARVAERQALVTAQDVQYEIGQRSVGECSAAKASYRKAEARRLRDSDELHGVEGDGSSANAYREQLGVAIRAAEAEQKAADAKAKLAGDRHVAAEAEYRRLQSSIESFDGVWAQAMVDFPRMYAGYGPVRVEGQQSLSFGFRVCYPNESEKTASSPTKPAKAQDAYEDALREESLKLSKG